MEIIRCDECGNLAEGYVADWFQVDDIPLWSINTQRVGEKPKPWHFCSPECVIDYFDRMVT